MAIYLDKLSKTLKNWVQCTNLALFPTQCVCCHQAATEIQQIGLCAHCFSLVEKNVARRCGRCDIPLFQGQHQRCAQCLQSPPPFSKVRAPFLYGGPMKDVISAIKFRERTDLAKPLAHLLANDCEATQLAQKTTVLIPIPMSKVRLRKRGYNQASLLASALSKKWEIPISFCLEKIHETPSQAFLNRSARMKNLEDCYLIKRRLVGSSVLLVDDVVTTTATVQEAARAILKGGATEVNVISVARAD